MSARYYVSVHQRGELRATTLNAATPQRASAMLPSEAARAAFNDWADADPPPGELFTLGGDALGLAVSVVWGRCPIPMTEPPNR